MTERERVISKAVGGLDPRDERLRSLLTAAYPAAEPPAALEQGVAELVARHTAREARPVREWPLRRFAWGAAGALALASAALLLLRSEEVGPRLAQAPRTGVERSQSQPMEVRQPSSPQGAPGDREQPLTRQQPSRPGASYPAAPFLPSEPGALVAERGDRGHLPVPALHQPFTPPAPGGDLAYVNEDPLESARSWAPRSAVEKWSALEAWVRQNVRVRDDFVQIPFPRVAATSDRATAAAVDEYKREAAVVDTRLFQKMTLQQRAVSFEAFCQELARQSGIRIEAGRGVADEKVTAFMQERPLREVMRHVNRLFGFTWLRSGKEGEYRYELVQDLRSQLVEEELRNRDLNEALLALDREMQALRPYRHMTPEQLRAKAEAATNPEQKKRLELLAGKAWGPVQLYFQLSPEELVALRSGQELGYGSQPKENERPLPAEMRLPVLDTFSHYSYWKGKNGGHGLSPHGSVPEGAERYEPKALPEAQATVRLSASRSELGQISLQGVSGFSVGGTGVSNGSSIATGVSPSVTAPKNAQANAALARDPALQPLVSWRPESSCRCGTDYVPAYPYGRNFAASARRAQIDEVAREARGPQPVSTADVLAAIHRATGIDLLSDAFTRVYPPAAVSVEKRRLFDALNQAADVMRYRWRKQDGVLLFRSAGYFNDKLKEVPNRLLERWAVSIRRQGRPTLDDLIEMAQLRDAQLNSAVIAEGVVRCYGIKGWSIVRGHMRRHLLLLALLDAEQRRLAQSPAGLPFRRMNSRQQQQYLAVGFGNSGLVLAPEELVGARLRVALSLPGEFEWTPPSEWNDFPTEQRVRAATRELALAAARRVEPTVTEAVILPTVADLQLEYSLGPGADGSSQFQLISTQSSRDGRRKM